MVLWDIGEHGGRAGSTMIVVATLQILDCGTSAREKLVSSIMYWPPEVTQLESLFRRRAKRQMIVPYGLLLCNHSLVSTLLRGGKETILSVTS